MKRGDVFWADLGPPVGRRPVLVLSRSAIMPALEKVVVVPVTTTIRGIESEVWLGPKEGLRRESVANCDVVLTVPRDRLGERAGRLDASRIPDLDDALRFAIGINY